MKKSELRNIIKEELQAVLHEKDEEYNVINKENGKLITVTPLKKSLALKLAAKKKDGKWIIADFEELMRMRKAMGLD